jgi:membrane protease YdiL (CAAX protease family)
MNASQSTSHPPAAARLTGWLRNHPLPAFFLLAFTFSWVIWFLAMLLPTANAAVFRQLNTLGAFGPALAALALQHGLAQPDQAQPALRRRAETCLLAFLAVSALYFICLPYASSLPLQTTVAGWVLRVALFVAAAWVLGSTLGGPEGQRRLLLPPDGSRTRPLYLVIALLAFPVVLLGGVGLNGLLGQPIQLSLVRADLPLFLASLLATFLYLFLFGGPLNEEPGWRGFALPRLQARFTPLVATLIVGLAWGAWHLPLYLNGFYPSAGPASLPGELALRLLTTLLLSFALTWLYNKTGGNVLDCALMHASFNTASTFIASTHATLALLAVVALAAALESRMWRRLPAG